MTAKEKINKWDYIKLESFCIAMKIIRKTKGQPTKWENMFSDISGKGLTSKIHQEIIKLNTHTQKANNPIKK